VLILAANPSDTSRLALDEEWRAIEQRVRGAAPGALDIVYAPAVRADEIAQALQRYTPAVVHFSGHGSREGELLLPDASGRASPATVESVTRLFQALAPEVPVRCVVLNACYSEALARALAPHVECVIGAPAALPDKLALAFAAAFYEALAFGRSLRVAFDVALAQVALTPNLRGAAPVAHWRDEASVAPPPTRMRKDSLDLIRAIPNPDAAYDPAWYMRRKKEESFALGYLLRRGSPAVLWAPERFGKSTMLQYLVREVLSAEPSIGHVVRVDLGLFDGDARQSFEAFLREFALQAVESLGASDELVDRVWKRPSGPSKRLTRALTQMLSGVEKSVVLAVDQCDEVLECPFSDDFFGMLRAWANEPGLEPLRLLLAVSTTPSLLNSRLTQSPFNLTTPIQLGDLDGAQVRDLAERHGLAPDDDALAALVGLVGGHPYLLRVAMFAAAMERLDLGDIARDEALINAVFEPFLSRYRVRFERHPELRDALDQAVRAPASRVDLAAGHRLHGAGLVTLDAHQCRVRYRLFERLVR
jgi:hypothetical protein